ncbi:Metallo-beta-lactamase superfamily protein [Pseudovibrio axinellae]|uniref:Linear primary-alkylsulfatase n=1 Tax=Pseudovibrio axinellae TaxID=989403 RepID=A0A166AQR7_9HYPH|nr:alkyl sulfatase dimerization domain-containing protein [Pseudovibrio axinellae]KZL21436.1 Metallo-beta-lactamase superfamily protein [Pseudovibrio axinellae]SER05230.1 Alkyl sulfatase BDS1, metallo-beta-lactamase superfamily [Pseudovibrio axinellae]
MTRNHINRTFPRHILGTTLALSVAWSLSITASTAETITKPATPYTGENYETVIKELPFADKEDFNDAKAGFISPLPDGGIVKNSKGEIVYDLSKFDFIMQGSIAPQTVNPSLWRQSQLILLSGFFKVSERIYQVRAADLSNITFIEGDEGIIIVDPLISEETARYALELYYAERGKKPVKAVIYTHSHVDHFGGVRGVVDEEDVKSGKVKIYAPEGFMEHAVAENVMAGNAMSRRATYMYGNLLPHSPEGQVGAGLGPTTSTGTITLIPPTDIITKNDETHKIDGLTFNFWMAQDSEAPSEFFFYIKELKALCTAEDATHTMHNTYSLRGAKLRDPLGWSKYINEAIYKYGKDIEVLYAPHHWHLSGNKKILTHLRNQRDLYRYINDQPLRLANHGFHMTEIAELLELPDTLKGDWGTRGYYGSLNHNVKSTYVRYLGWFNGNPATLHEYPEREAGKRYVEFMGGPVILLQKAQQSFDQGDYRWVVEVLNHLVFAQPDNKDAAQLQADALEQLGYQAESGPWRNFYLSGAQELRAGVKELPAPDTASPDIIRSMDIDLLFDYAAMRLNHTKAGDKQLKLNWVFRDTDQKYAMELQNSALSHIEGYQLDDADITVTLDRTTLDDIMLATETFDEAIKSGKVTVDGDPSKLTALLAMMDTFDFWFNIVRPVPLDKANQGATSK